MIVPDLTISASSISASSAEVGEEYTRGPKLWKCQYVL